jgi:hypothetical protein
MATKYLMQGVSLATEELLTWLSDAPDWTGVFAGTVVYDIALAGGGIDGSISSIPDGVMAFNDGSYVVFDDGSYVT